MKHTRYTYQSEDSLKVFKFNSEGRKGTVRKLVIYTETTFDNVYNLAFGDYDPVTKNIDDLSTTDNGDSTKVLATVASTVYVFIEQYPEAWIIATGSTPARTRLYQMSISRYLEEICEDFSIFGYNADGDWRKFAVGETYEIFLLTRKGNELLI